AKADRRLGAMSHAVRAQGRRQVEGRAVIDQPAIFGASEEAMSDVEVGAAPVDEGRASLRVGRGSVLGIEYQATDSSLDKRREAAERATVDIGCSVLMLV